MTKFDLLREVKDVESRAERAEQAISFVTGMLQVMNSMMAGDPNIPSKIKQNLAAMLDITYPIYRDAALRDGDTPYDKWTEGKADGEENA